MIVETFRERETETYTLRDTRKCVDKDASQNAEEEGGRTVSETKVHVRDKRYRSQGVCLMSSGSPGLLWFLETANDSGWLDEGRDCLQQGV